MELDTLYRLELLELVKELINNFGDGNLITVLYQHINSVTPPFMLNPNPKYNTDDYCSTH